MGKNKKPNINRNTALIGISVLFILTGLTPALNTAHASNTDILPAIHSMDIGSLGKMIDIQSFLNKPARLPIPSDNPDGVPGGDFDYLYIYPPQFFWNKAQENLISFPVKSVYFASGKSINAKKEKVVKEDVEKYINYCFCNEDKLLDDLKNKIKNQSREPRKPSYMEGIFKIFNLAHAAEETDANNNTDLTADEAASVGASAAEANTALQQLLDTDDPRIKQLLMLLLLNLFLTDEQNGTPVAQAANTEKEDCLDEGGEWINDECVTDSDTYDDSAEEEATCTDSGGKWDSVSSSRALCLARCGKTDTKCKGSALADFEDLEGIIEVDSEDLEGCKCPEGQCVDADGQCMDDESQSDDDDNDGVPNGQDKCSTKTASADSAKASSSSGSAGGSSSTEQVNMNSGSPYYGCSCSQLQAMGAITQKQCPASQCEEGTPYFVEYPPSGQDQCVNGVVTPTNCSPISRQPRQDCAALAQQRQQQQNQNDNKGQQGGQQDKGQQDKDQQDKGQQDKGQQGCGDQPSSPGSPNNGDKPQPDTTQKPPPAGTTTPEAVKKAAEHEGDPFTKPLSSQEEASLRKINETLERGGKVEDAMRGQTQSVTEQLVDKNGKLTGDKITYHPDGSTTWETTNGTKKTRQFNDSEGNYIGETTFPIPEETVQKATREYLAEEMAKNPERLGLNLPEKSSTPEEAAEMASTGKISPEGSSTDNPEVLPPQSPEEATKSNEALGTMREEQLRQQASSLYGKRDPFSPPLSSQTQQDQSPIKLFDSSQETGKQILENPALQDFINSPEYQQLASGGLTGGDYQNVLNNTEFNYWDKISSAETNLTPMIGGQAANEQLGQEIFEREITADDIWKIPDQPSTAPYYEGVPSTGGEEQSMPWQDTSPLSGFDSASGTYVPSSGSPVLPEIPQSTGGVSNSAPASGFSSAGDYIDSGGGAGLTEMYGGYSGGPIFDPRSIDTGSYTQSIWDAVLQAAIDAGIESGIYPGLEGGIPGEGGEGEGGEGSEGEGFSL